MSPTFSVVIPTYNQADFLRVALRSVLSQTFEDFEVIVVNNFSTDHTMEVIREVTDQRVHAVDFHNDGVIGAGRNVGIKVARAPYVAFLDSDDSWYSNKLEKVAEAIEADPEAGVVCHNQEIVRDGQVAQLSNYGPPERYRGSLYDYLVLVSNCVCLSASVVAKRYLDEVGYFSEDRDLITVEDYDLWVKLSKACRFRFIPDVLGRLHFHPSSASANAEMHLQSSLAILEKHLAELQADQRSYPNGAIRLRYAKAFFGAARQYHRRGVLTKALRYYMRTVRVDPLYLSTYAGLGLLFADLMLGRSRRKTITDTVKPGV